MLGRKNPGEIAAFSYDFREKLAGDSINAVDDVASDPRGAGANITEEGQAFAGGIVTILWGGGADGESYLTTVKITASGGAKYEVSGEVLVESAAFQVPSIAGTYLSGDEYVDRFGREETIRITDESRLGQIDESKLTAALADATEFTEGYLRSRYELPLASPPSMIKGIVAAIAREMLFRTRPTQAVTEAADRARSLLKDIALGRVVLSLEGGEAPEITGGGLPVYAPSFDAIVFNADKLLGF